MHITAYNLKCTTTKAVSDASSTTSLPPKVHGNTLAKTHLHSSGMIAAMSPDLRKNHVMIPDMILAMIAEISPGILTIETNRATRYAMTVALSPNMNAVNFLTINLNLQRCIMITNMRKDLPRSLNSNNL